MRKNFLIGCLLASMPMAALAGEGNRIDLLQNATGGEGNTLSVDQANASNSLVAGNPLDFSLAVQDRSPAQQIGDGNTASLTLSGDGTGFFLEQGQTSDPAFGNEAIAVIAGLNGLGGIRQSGSDNEADLSLTADGASGLIVQDGRSNRAGLTIDGLNASGELRQIGNDNENFMTVSGAGASVVFTQQGNGLVNSQSAGGVQVFTDANSVSITQTAAGFAP